MVFESLVRVAEAILSVSLLDLAVLAGFGFVLAYIAKAFRKLLGKDNDDD